MKRTRKHRLRSKQRRGSGAMDLFLVIGIIIPLVAFLYTVVPRMIQLVYEMAIVIIGNPLM